MLFKKLVFLVLITGIPCLVMGQNFSLSTIDLTPVYSGVIKWADLDNDGDLDIIYNGFTEGANEFYTKIYENNDGTFVSRETDLPGIRNGGFALGDYDKDGDLDVLLTGLSDEENISVLFENHGAFSFSLKESYPGLINSIPAWFDIDSDGDLDFLFAGIDEYAGEENPFIARMHVYENTATGFEELQDTNLPPCAQCSIDFGDVNGDSKIDVIITGLDYDSFGQSGLYLNNGDNTFSLDQNSELHQVFNGDVKFGDFDNDGDPDVLLGGGQNNGGEYLTLIYENSEGVLLKREDIEIVSTTENWNNGTQWVDYNNDGYLDIVVAGRGGSNIAPEFVMKIYKNNGDNTFTEISEENFFGLIMGSIDFEDFDNDGDADLCFIGYSPTGVRAGVFINELNIVSINDEIKYGIKIYPNPASDELSLNIQAIPSASYISIHDQLGREVLRKTIDKNELVINLKDLNEGAFIVSIIGAEGKVLYQKRVIKEY